MTVPAPSDVGYRVIAEMMARGSDKDGRDDSWRRKGRNYHLLKAIRHATTGLMILEGHQLPDGEDHLTHALTRLAMAMAQRGEMG